MRSIEDFKKDKIPMLVATDVAGRGLDVQDVELVVNYTCAGQLAASEQGGRGFICSAQMWPDAVPRRRGMVRFELARHVVTSRNFVKISAFFLRLYRH